MKKKIFAVFSICLMLALGNGYFEHQREMGSPKLSRMIDEDFIFESAGGGGPKSNGGGGPKLSRMIDEDFIFESGGGNGPRSNGRDRPKSCGVIVDCFIFGSNGEEKIKLAGMTARVNEVKVHSFKEYPLKNGGTETGNPNFI